MRFSRIMCLAVMCLATARAQQSAELNLSNPTIDYYPPENGLTQVYAHITIENAGQEPLKKVHMHIVLSRVDDSSPVTTFEDDVPEIKPRGSVPYVSPVYNFFGAGLLKMHVVATDLAGHSATRDWEPPKTPGGIPGNH